MHRNPRALCADVRVSFLLRLCAALGSTWPRLGIEHWTVGIVVSTKPIRVDCESAAANHNAPACNRRLDRAGLWAFSPQAMITTPPGRHNGSLLLTGGNLVHDGRRLLAKRDES